MRPSLCYLTDSDEAGKPAISAGIAKNGKRSSPDRPTAPLRMGNTYPECGACQHVRQAADAPKLHTPSRARTNWAKREPTAPPMRAIAFYSRSKAPRVGKESVRYSKPQGAP